MTDKRVLRAERTEEAKAYRHLHGDKGARFSDKIWMPSEDPWSNTISTVTKDNMIEICYW